MAYTDKERLDWLEHDNLSGLSVILDSYLGIEKAMTLRQAIDKAMGEEKVNHVNRASTEPDFGIDGLK